MARTGSSKLGLLTLLASLAVVVLACGSTADQSDSEASQESPTTTAIFVASTLPSSSTPEPEQEPADDAQETMPATEPVVLDGDTEFGLHILPIMANSCSSCHGPDQAGSDHFTIETAADVQAYAAGVKAYVSEKEMPPWPSSPASLEFQDNPSLTEEEIARIVAWVDEGAELDVDPETPIVSTRPQSTLQGEDRDIVMTAVNAPYTGSSSIVDEYRCLVFDPGNTELEYITASHFEPDNTQVVHHAIVTLASGSLRDQAEELDAADPGPGWSCYGGVGFGGVEGGYTTRLGGWAPGGQPARQPEGYAIPLTAGDFVVVQIHYHYDGAATPDSSRYVLGLASQEQIDANAGWFKRLTGRLYLGPAEIPCYEGDTDPLCDRSTALARVQELYGPRVGAYSNFFLNQCGAKAEDFAAMTDGTSWTSCDLPVTNPGVITGVTGHMHELGLSIRLTLNPDTPEERILLDIPDWDFEWQFGYKPVEEIVIDTDDVIRVDCAWNRERAPYDAVGYILWADGTGDEMCYSSIVTAPLD